MKIISEFDYCNLPIKVLLSRLNYQLEKASNPNIIIKKVSLRTINRMLVELNEMDFITTKRIKNSNSFSRWISDDNKSTIHNYFGAAEAELENQANAIDNLETKLREAKATNKKLEETITKLTSKIKIMGQAAVDNISTESVIEVNDFEGISNLTSLDDIKIESIKSSNVIKKHSRRVNKVNELSGTVKTEETLEVLKPFVEETRDRRVLNNFNEYLILDLDLVEFYYKEIKNKRRLVEKLRTNKFDKNFNSWIRTYKEGREGIM
tara:strand:- start:1561 stop:2355 length:795 start_codon:yes stop_codon:yes gene_type:complete